jgi:hypothetical protein
MKPPFLLTLAALAAAGCAHAATLYQPSANLGDVGYYEIPIAANLWRVTFQGDTGAGYRQVDGLAMRRAAELTLAKGYDWFRIEDRDVEAGLDASGAQLPVGGYNTDFGGYGMVGGGGGMGVADNQAVAVTIEIVMGRGPAPTRGAYDARQIERDVSRGA